MTYTERLTTANKIEDSGAYSDGNQRRIQVEAGTNGPTTHSITLTCRNFLLIVIAAQLLLLVAFGLDKSGFQPAFIRQAIVLVYLTLLPGILLVWILKLRDLSAIEALSYSVGLSLSFLMFVGMLISSLYPQLGIARPISEMPLLATISATVLVLSFVGYSRNKGSSVSFSVQIRPSHVPYVLFCVLLPLVSVLGIWALRWHNDNFVLLVLFAVVSVVPVLAIVGKLPTRLFPLAIWVIALSLLLYNGLTPVIIRPTDNPAELLWSSIIVRQGYWDPTFPSIINGEASVTMLCPTYSILCNMGLIWVFKLALPLLFTVVPVGLYLAFQKKTGSKIAFLAVFFFIAQFTFFTWTPVNAKTVFAEIFLMLLMLLLSDDKIKPQHKVFLSIVFALSMVTSHYGTPYMLLFALVMALLVLSVIRRLRPQRVESKSLLVRPTFVLLLGVCCIGWYLFSTNSSGFWTIVDFSNTYVHTISTQFLFPTKSADPHVAWESQMLLGHWPLTLSILRFLFFAAAFFTGIGILHSSYKQLKTRSFEEYTAVALAFFALLAVTEVSGGVYSGGRMYHIASFFTAPFCVVGLIVAFRTLTRIGQKLWGVRLGPRERPDIPTQNSPTQRLAEAVGTGPAWGSNSYSTLEKTRWLAFVSIILMVFFLVNCGFVSEVVLKDSPGASVYISQRRIMETGDLSDKEYLYRTIIPNQDFVSARWLAAYKDPEMQVLTDSSAALCMNGIGPDIGSASTDLLWLTDPSDIVSGSYIYLGYYNVVEGGIIREQFWSPDSAHPISEVLSALTVEDRIYSNGGSDIYYSP